MYLGFSSLIRKHTHLLCHSVLGWDDPLLSMSQSETIFVLEETEPPHAPTELIFFTTLNKSIELPAPPTNNHLT